jgi:signal transduction histidine kinase/CheY-like chemotaxis protein
MQKIYSIAAVLMLVSSLTIEWLDAEIFRAEMIADDALDHSEALVHSSVSAMRTAKALKDDLTTSNRIRLQFELRTQVRDLRQRIENLEFCISQEQGFLGTPQSELTIKNALIAARDLSNSLDNLAQISDSDSRNTAFQMIRFTVEPRLRFSMDEIVTIVKADMDQLATLTWWVRVGGTSSIIVILVAVWFFLIAPADKRQKKATQALEVRRKQAQELAKKAEAASEAKTRFLSTMSHELRTPLNGVIGMAELVEPMVESLEAREMVGTIRTSGEHLIKIVNEILDFSKIESGELTVEKVPFDISKTLSEIKTAHAQEAKQKGLSFEVTSDDVKSRHRLGDSHKLKQILNNLIGNSLKFTEQGRVEIRVSEYGNADIKIIVKDTGIGMSAQQLDVLFVGFVQADTSIARRFGGTGLGMSITKNLIEAMSGDINVSSVLGKGSKFTIRLPLEPGQEPTPKKEATTNIVKIAENLRVLAVDDNKTNRLVLGKMLNRMGLHVTICESGEQAVQAAKAAEFDLFLFDISMPEMDGIQCLEAINWYKAEVDQDPTPAIAVTANTLPEQVNEYLRCGFDNCLAKPIRAAELQSAITKTVDVSKMVA